jgi:16S rRNA (guanine(966)-N(2))-methyltransferase RsmD
MRITGGALRSRQLRAPRGDATRPTSDRVREALFSILGDIVGVRVLDLYAGTGALALEALSRGAAHATLVESGREPLAVLRANVAALGVESRVRVVAQAVERAAKALGEPAAPFDLVFADPPYADVRGDAPAVRALAALAPTVMSDGGILVLEHAERDEPPAIEGLGLEETRRYGDTSLSFYRRGVCAAV